MWVLDVEVIAARLHFVGKNFPCDLRFYPSLTLRAAPPIDTGLEMLDANWLSHRVGFLIGRHTMFVKPDFLGWLPLLEEKKVGAHRGVGFERAVGEPHDCMEIALL